MRRIRVMKTAFSGLGTLRQLPFYRTARDAFNRLFHPQAFVERKRTMKLLGGFVHPGSLVFDVGANHGKYTERIGLMNMKRWLAPRCLPALTRSCSLTSTRADHEGLCDSGRALQGHRSRQVERARRAHRAQTRLSLRVGCTAAYARGSEGAASGGRDRLRPRD
jgi:hypothetical protein